MDEFIGFFIALLVTAFTTPLVKRLAFFIGAVDRPDSRKVHRKVMPRLGGLAMYFGFTVALLLLWPGHPSVYVLLIGGGIILLVGILDDKFQISPVAKLIGQFLAALVPIIYGFQVNLLNLPFDRDSVFLGWLSIPVTLIWVIGVTNAVNLIDGLDGLAAGVAAIATTSMLVMAVIMGNWPVVFLCSLLLGSVIGFLFYNFHPAQIFMGDSGSLFLGYSLAVLSLLGFKQVTFVSLVIPILILAVPISDTFFAIIRRLLHKKPVMQPDRNHLHHRLLEMGLTHRQTVLSIYGIAAIFGMLAVFLSQATALEAIVLVIIILIAAEIGVEKIGLVSKRYQPVINLLKRVQYRLRVSFSSESKKP
ncbi:MAG: undecaprenyl-phosphate alpha-N-acetylglucosaminyl 1-phosphate transferase [Bacillus thermozeamaize]|uniref:Undecaprenyl-phosphate alpha-N-acetylglucosaminyl 1-phosphate transferase n=1 Tax=Bacillus thermozeamaize TaxID=230954 RepID=A0A1Y3PA19_9BACI|nr:MAG: undecaprenyl-phosphate alpha-N-acetylglucosaminyl 1-phosphate transferase [Bacillus thermozeamaize]